MLARQETCSALRVKKGSVSRLAGWGPNLMDLYQGCCCCEVLPGACGVYSAVPRAPDTGDPALSRETLTLTLTLSPDFVLRG
jgi:hypothetical protein